MVDKKLEMTKDEIVCSYKEATDKRKQVIILSELNACKPEVIIEILKESGMDARTLPRLNTKPRGNNTSKAVAESNTTETVESSETQVNCNPTKLLQDTYNRLTVILDSIPENASDVLINQYKSLMLQLCDEAVNTIIQLKVNGKTN